MQKIINTIKLVFVFLLVTQANAQTIDKVAAIVNDQIITEREFEQRYKIIKKRITEDKINVPDNVLSTQVMQNLIQENVLLQFAKEQGFAPNNEQLDKILNEQAQAQGITVRALKSKMYADGLSENSLNKQLSIQLIIGYIRNNIIFPSIKVTSAEIDAYLSDKTGSNLDSLSAEVNVAHIVIKVSENASTEAKNIAFSKAKTIKDELSKGAEFSDLAVRYSDFSDAKSGGVIGFRPINRLPDIYQNKVVSMKIGDVSDVFESPNGYHIVKLVDKRKNVLQNVERIRARHILIRQPKGTTDEQVIRELLAIKARILAGESFSTLAQKYSQDESAKLGGDLGWLYPGDTVREFEMAMVNLKDGQISDPVRTQYGWHIIAVTAREEVPLPVDKARQLAIRAISEEKSDAAFANMVDELVAKSYINVIRDKK